MDLRILLMLVSSNLLAMNVKIAPSVIYESVKDNECTSTSQKAHGLLMGSNASITMPFLRHNWFNTANASFSYGVLDFTRNDDTSVINYKSWIISAEDTMAFYSKINSKTAPYIGFGYSYNKYRDESDADKNINYRRAYLPIGFLVKLTESFSLDLRYERDIGKNLNKNKILDNEGEFERGNGAALSVKFKPFDGAGIAIKYMHHKSLFKTDQSHIRNSIGLQFIWSN